MLVAVLTPAGAGRWARIRLCHAPDRRWAFYDRSKNRSRQWCAMAVRPKGRAFRGRRRAVTRQP